MSATDKSTTTETTANADGSSALFDPGECLDCGHLQPTGTFTRRWHEKGTESFRVVYVFDELSMTFVDVKTIESARASACGFPNAKILQLELNAEGPSAR